jgi:hypothetical protein
MKHLALLGLALLLAPAHGFAQDPDAIQNAVGAPPADTMGSIGGDLNFGQIDGDWVTTVNVGLNFDLGQIGFGIQAPLHLVLKDNDPKNDWYGGVLRRQDWDEWTDYLKILRYFRYGRKGQLIFVQVGDLPGATLGHGTIANRYYNNTDIDHYRMGIQIDVNTDYAGVETLFNNGFISNLIGARAYVKPWSFVDTESYLNNLAVGLTVVTDWNAPYCLKNPMGQCRPDQSVVDGDQVAAIDGSDNLQVANRKAATVIGGDIEFRLLNTDYLALTPYIDLNGIVDGGFGMHIGILSVFHIPVVSIDLSARVEYRYFQPDYVPAYFDSFYEIQKFGYPFKDELGVFGAAGMEVTNRPKRRVIEEMTGDWLNGYFAELVLDVMGWVQLGASYDDYDGPFNSNLRMYVAIPALEVIQFGAYYYRHNFEGASEAFAFDEKSLFLAEARWQVWSILYLIGQYWRTWQLDTDQASDSFGEYVPIDDWSVGLGVAYTF